MTGARDAFPVAGAFAGSLAGIFTGVFAGVFTGVGVPAFAVVLGAAGVDFFTGVDPTADFDGVVVGFLTGVDVAGCFAG